MSPTVEKWAAGIWCDRLYVIKGHFKVTPKQYRREGGTHSDDMDLALKWRSVFDHDTDLLHDTQAEALEALHSRELREILNLQKGVERAQTRIDLVEEFEV